MVFFKHGYAAKRYHGVRSWLSTCYITKKELYI